MSFIPYHDKIVIEPIESKGIVQTGEKRLLQKGKVISIGDYKDALVDLSWFKIGDIVYFDSWGCTETEPDSEGKTHYVVTVSEATIYGKEQ